MLQHRHRRTAIRGWFQIAPAALLILGVYFYPLASLFLSTFTQPLGWLALANVWIEPQFQEALITSILLSFSAAAAGTLLAWPSAWFLARSGFRWTAILRLAFVLPLAFSGVLVGFFFVLLLGRVGLVPEVAQRLTGYPLLSGLAYEPAGLFLAYLYFEVPRATLTLEATFRSFDPAWLQSARTLGANRWQRFNFIVWPIVRPAIVSTFGLAFAVSLGSFGAALILSHRIKVLALEMFEQLVGFNDWRQANALAAVLLAIGLGVLWLTAANRAAGGMRAVRQL